ncbi:MAG: hypothetical protein JXA33_28770 [Anaerolineae bacterium]|nr:hypothetical protein [Anaerolineae bacterium]
MNICYTPFINGILFLNDTSVLNSAILGMGVIITIAQLIVVLGLLLWADRWLHRQLQGVMLLIANDPEIALWLYALLLFPGVCLHEVSHAVVAAILGVKIGRINIFPKRIGNRIQLGFVPVQETDFLRASLIGAAPLLSGSAVVVAVGHFVFGTPDVVTALSIGDWFAALRGLRAAFNTPDVWIWAYLVFTIGNTMLPSRSDVHAWPILIGVLIVLGALLSFCVIGLAGEGTMLLNGFSYFLTITARWIILLGGSTLLIDMPFFITIFLAKIVIEYVKGVRLEYQ